VKKQLQAAGRRGARHAVVVSSDHADTVAWKDLKNRTEERIADSAVAAAADSAGKD
jgi:hypothetical protein